MGGTWRVICALDVNDFACKSDPCYFAAYLFNGRFLDRLYLAGLCVKTLLFWMVLTAVIGQFLGYLLIEVIDDNTLKAVIGALALVTGVRYWLAVLKPTMSAPSRAAVRDIRRRFRQRSAIWCTFSGLSSFISLTGGIGVQIFMLPMAIHRFFFVGTLAWYFLFINLAKIPFFFDLELFTAQTLA